MKLEEFSVQEWNWENNVVEEVVFICEHQNILYSFTRRREFHLLLCLHIRIAFPCTSVFPPF
jgi:hypothetical protein